MKFKKIAALCSCLFMVGSLMCPMAVGAAAEQKNMFCFFSLQLLKRTIDFIIMIYKEFFRSNYECVQKAVKVYEKLFESWE